MYSCFFLFCYEEIRLITWNDLGFSVVSTIKCRITWFCLHTFTCCLYQQFFEPCHISIRCEPSFTLYSNVLILGRQSINNSSRPTFSPTNVCASHLYWYFVWLIFFYRFSELLHCHRHLARPVRPLHHRRQHLLSHRHLTRHCLHLAQPKHLHRCWISRSQALQRQILQHRRPINLPSQTKMTQFYSNTILIFVD